jgi:radical SAM protein with 4Fe4S-binding SPASM domain
MSVAEIGVRTFEQRLQRGARSARHPLNCLFELTPTCNLRCHFCYVALDPYQGPYLSTQQVYAVLDKLQTAGVLWLTLTGGEIFSRRDFAEIYRYAYLKGFLITLFTNATMMNEKLGALFRELPPFLAEVSIYGHTAEVYEATTQIKGSFGRFERGINLLMQAGVPLKLKTQASKFTQDHLSALFKYAEDRGLKFAVDLMIDYRHDGGDEPTLYRLSTRKVLELGEEIDAINATRSLGRQIAVGEETSNPMPTLAASARADVARSEAAPMGTARKPSRPLPECSIEDPSSSKEDLYRCGAGRVALFVNALGQASHCVIDRDPSFPILEMEWDDLWAQMGAWVTQPLPKDAPCSGCDMRSSCGSCPARSRLATGSPYFKDPYYCDVTHAQHGLPPANHPDYRSAARPLGACAS